jgi:histidinol dehydrogenase
MSAMKIIRTIKEREAFLGKLRKRARSVDTSTLKATERIIRSVMRGGDKALKGLTRRFDGHETIKLPPRRIASLARKARPATLKALRLAARRIRRFHARQMESSWQMKEPGISLGQMIRPLERVGVYVPGGKAAYPSTVLMNVIPAQVAGVEEIAVAVPTPGGEADPNVMAALELLGIREVYSIGGAQAVAAFAYGTRTIRKVDKIVGPGNVFVATAKRMVFGEVDVDMIAGPSEILVIADRKADPSFVAADLLSQAEHDEIASPILVTDSLELAEAVNLELRRRLRRLSRSSIASASLRRYGAAIIVKSMKEATEVSNLIAPEHLEIMTARPRRLLPLIRNAGAVFLGPWTPEPVGDYAAGPNHTLPTGSTSRWASPLGVYDFLKRTSVLEFTKKGFDSLADAVELIAVEEGLDAHAESVRARKGNNST